MSNSVREIITKAIVSKGTKKSIKKYTFELESISKVLGCYLSNHHFEASFKDGVPVVIGTYDLHLWYSLYEDSVLYKTQISYVDEMELRIQDDRSFKEEDTIEADCIKEPKCVGANLEGTIVSLEIEKEMTVRIIGDACLLIKTHDNELMEIDEDYLK